MGDFINSLLVLLWTASALFCSALPASGQGFKVLTPIAPSAVVHNTAEKPQSKVWYHAGKWWAVFAKADGTYIGRLDGSDWSLNLKISSSTSVEADCKVTDNVCHIFLWRKPANPSQLISVQYDASSASYRFWSQRSQMVHISLDSGSETGTIDIDATGRMWLASDGVDDIRVRWSDPPYGVWNGPEIIATGLIDDDICAVISLPVQGQIGVLWSNQNTRRFGFKTHTNGTPPSAWSADEVPASASALNIGKGMADDHLNLALATDGTLYCAVKTSYDTPGYPRIALLRRFPDGSWDRLYEVSQMGTRGIVILNETEEKLKVIYTAYEVGGPILYRESSTSAISFSDPLTLLDGVYNNPTSTKDNYEESVLILASNETTLGGVIGADRSSVTVGVSQSEPFSRTKFYPNPVNDALHLQVGDDIGGDLSVSITDALGRLYVRTQFPDRSNQIEINLGYLNLKSGIYFLSVRSSKHFEVMRFIKQ